MNLKLTPWHYEELIKKGYTLDSYFMLKLVDEGYDLSSTFENVKMKTLFAFLVRKGLVTETDGKITSVGRDLITFMSSRAKTTTIAKRTLAVNDFETWWKAYPGTDTFEHKGRRFSGSRTLRQNKEECFIKFDKVIMEGEYTARDLIDALLLDVHQKKEASVKQKTNKLTYMQNSLTYLNQRSFEPFIELVKQGVKTQEEPENTGGTDV